MRYITKILLDDEVVLYDGRVHPRVLMHGMLWMGVSALILTLDSNTGGHSAILLNAVLHLSNAFTSFKGFYNLLLHWQLNSSNTSFDVKIIALLIALYGIRSFFQQLIIMQTTELVVTDQRVIAKTGVLDIITLELDRRRIAGVRVYQTFMGRIMNYGYVMIEGFTANIGGLPIMVNPHLVEKFLS